MKMEMKNTDFSQKPLQSYCSAICLNSWGGDLSGLIDSTQRLLVFLIFPRPCDIATYSLGYSDTITSEFLLLKYSHIRTMVLSCL